MELILDFEGDKLCKDSGGWTKYGISQRALMPGAAKKDIENLTLPYAVTIYQGRYWKYGSCDSIGYPLSLVHFDSNINHGKKQSAKFLQRALNALGGELIDDGVIGAKTIAEYKRQDQYDNAQEALVGEYLLQRLEFFRYLAYDKKYCVVNDEKFFFVDSLNGWMVRIRKLRDFLKNNRTI